VSTGDPERAADDRQRAGFQQDDAQDGRPPGAERAHGRDLALRSSVALYIETNR